MISASAISNNETCLDPKKAATIINPNSQVLTKRIRQILIKQKAIQLPGIYFPPTNNGTFQLQWYTIYLFIKSSIEKYSVFLSSIQDYCPS